MSTSSNSTRTTKIYPVSQPRKMVLNRVTPNASGISISTKSSSGIGGGSYGGITDPELAKLHTGVGERIESRTRQKEQMNELNERLADYIEKVRFLDAQNRKLRKELDVLQERHGRGTDHVRARYECEIKNLKELIAESEKEKINAEKDLEKTLDDLNKLRDSVDEQEKEHLRNQEIKDRLNKQLADMEGEIAVLRRRAGTFDEVKSRNKEEIARLRNEEARLKKDLDNEIQSRFKADLEANFLKDVIESTEGAHLVLWQDTANKVYQDSTAENREAWSSEFKKKFKQIQDAYEQKVEEVTDEINESMTLKLRQNVGAANRDQYEMTIVRQEMSSLGAKLSQLQSRIDGLNMSIKQQEGEVSSLEAQIASAQKSNKSELEDLRNSLQDMKSNCNQAKVEVQKFFDMKLSTEVELSAYKRLLDSETVAETINFFDSGKHQMGMEEVTLPQYYSTSMKSFLGMKL